MLEGLHYKTRTHIVDISFDELFVQAVVVGHVRDNGFDEIVEIAAHTVYLEHTGYELGGTLKGSRPLVVVLICPYPRYKR